MQLEPQIGRRLTQISCFGFGEFGVAAKCSLSGWGAEWDGLSAGENLRTSVLNLRFTSDALGHTERCVFKSANLFKFLPFPVGDHSCPFAMGLNRSG
jgi:hypothetical protein